MRRKSNLLLSSVCVLTCWLATDARSQSDNTEILWFFQQIQDWPGFRHVEKEIVAAAGRGDLLVDANHRMVEKDWMPVKERVPVGSRRWKAKLYRKVLSTGLPGSDTPIPITALRLECPGDLKNALRKGAKSPDAKKTESYNKALAEYALGALVLSGEFADYLVGVSNYLEKMYAPKDYLFVPSMKLVGLMPHYDYDIVIFFVSGVYLKAAQQEKSPSTK
jgi:hypothetical protein